MIINFLFNLACQEKWMALACDAQQVKHVSANTDAQSAKFMVCGT
jgi:hypothetical protein